MGWKIVLVLTQVMMAVCRKRGNVVIIKASTHVCRERGCQYFVWRRL